MKKTILFPSQAEEICDAHEIRQLLDNEEEREMLRRNNPSLFLAYQALVALADSPER